MAAKRHLIAVFLLLAAAGAVILLLISVESREPQFSEDDLKFIDVYVKLSIAREMPAVKTARQVLDPQRILAESGVDSLWMARYARSLSGNIDKQLLIWKEITSRLDSLQKTAPEKKQEVLSPAPR